MNAQIRKKIAALMLSGLLCANLALPTYGMALDKIMLNGVEKSLSTPIVKTDASVLISIRALAEATGMKITWDAQDATVHCTLDSIDYVFKIGSRDVLKGSESKSLSAPVQIVNGASYIPLNAVVDVFGGQVALNEDAYQLSISINGSNAFGSYAFDDLYKRVLDNSVAYQQVLINLERAEIVQEDARDSNIDYPSNNGNATLEAVKLASLLGMESADIGLETSKIAVLTKQDELKYTLKTKLNTARTASLALKLAEKDYSLQQEIHRQNVLKYENGLISRIEMEKSIESEKSKLNAVSIKGSELNASLIALEDLLKLGTGSYGFTNNYDAKLDLLESRDLEGHISDVLENSPDIFALKQAVSYAETGLKYYVFNAGGTPYEAEKIDVTKARQDLQAAKEATDKSLRTLFEQIVQAETGYDALLIEYSKVQKDYEVAKVNKAAGLTTDLSVRQLEYAMDAIKYQMLSLKGTYEALTMSYLQPWAAQ